MASVYLVNWAIFDGDHGSHESKTTVYSTLKSANRAAQKELRKILVDADPGDVEDEAIRHDKNRCFKMEGQLMYKSIKVSVTKRLVRGPDLAEGEKDTSSGNESGYNDSEAEREDEDEEGEYKDWNEEDEEDYEDKEDEKDDARYKERADKKRADKKKADSKSSSGGAKKSDRQPPAKKRKRK